MQNDFDLPVSDRFLHTEVPSHYRHAQAGESEEEFASRLAGQLEEAKPWKDRRPPVLAS